METNSILQELSFSTERLEEIALLKTSFPEGKEKSALLRILHLAQEEFGGWLSIPVMDYVAGLLNIKPIEVYEVASFYSMYNLKPVGKVMLEVCQTGPCCTVGAVQIIKYLEDKLKITVGETTADGMFTLKTVECLGACGYAPMMQVGMHYYEHLDEAKVDTLLDEFRRRAESGENMYVKMKN